MNRVMTMIVALAMVGCDSVRDFLGLSFKDGTFIVHQFVKTEDRFKGTGCDVDYARERKMSCATGPGNKDSVVFVACAGDGYAFNALMSRSASGTWHSDLGPKVKVDEANQVECVTGIELLGPLPGRGE